MCIYTYTYSVCIRIYTYIIIHTTMIFIISYNFRGTKKYHIHPIPLIHHSCNLGFSPHALPLPGSRPCLARVALNDAGASAPRGDFDCLIPLKKKTKNHRKV